MSTALVTSQPFPGGSELTDMRNAASLLAQAQIVPEAFRANPANIMVALLTARGMGLDPMVALQKGYVIKGRFDVEVSVKLGLVMARVPDFDYEVVELDDKHARIVGGRKGRKQADVTFTFAQAEAAGLTKDRNGNDVPTWKHYRQDMLTYRALGRVLKLTCAFALYNMPVVLDETEYEVIDESPNGAPAKVESGNAAPQGAAPSVAVTAPTSPANVVHPLPAQPAPVLEPAPFVHTPGDWLGRLCDAIRAHYSIKAQVPATTPERTTWLKNANKDGKVLRLVNLFYEAHKEPEVRAWLSVAPIDYERLALWIEAQAQKRAGAGAASDAPGTKEASPAPQSGAVVLTEPNDTAPGDVVLPPGFEEEEEAPEAPDAEEPARIAGYEALAQKGLLHLLTVLDSLRQATKGERIFWKQSARDKRPILLDGPILVACGYVNDQQAPLAQWLDTIAAQPAAWLMLCRAVHEECLLHDVKYL